MANTNLDLIFPVFGGKEVQARDDGGDISSDAGLLLVSLADRRLALTESMASCVRDSRQRSKVVHSFFDMMRERVFAISNGYEDANDLDRLCSDPALKTACERLPSGGADLASQPTISRFENRPSGKTLVRMATCMAKKVVYRLAAHDKEGYHRCGPDRRSLLWPAAISSSSTVTMISHCFCRYIYT